MCTKYTSLVTHTGNNNNEKMYDANQTINTNQVDTSSDISKDVLRSFKEYSTSELDDMSDVAIENKHPLSVQINYVMRHKAKFFNTLSSAANVGIILNNAPNAIVKMPTKISTLKKHKNALRQTVYSIL